MFSFLNRKKCDNCGSKDHLIRIYVVEDKDTKPEDLEEKFYLCTPCHSDLRDPDDFTKQADNLGVHDWRR